MTIRLDKVRKIKKRLLRLHRKVHSWRVLARQYPPVKFGTLQRFATDPDYIPVDETLLVALGLMRPRKPRDEKPRVKEPTPAWLHPIKRGIRMMVSETRKAMGL